jgi:hypothetical protein
MQNHDKKEIVKNQDSMGKNISFLAPYPLALVQFQPHGYMWELLKKIRKNELKTNFEQKFTMVSYGVGL